MPLKYDDYTHYQLDKKQMMKQDWSGNWVIETDWATGKVKMPNDEIVEPDSPIVQRYVAMYKKLTAENPGIPVPILWETILKTVNHRMPICGNRHRS